MLSTLSFPCALMAIGAASGSLAHAVAGRLIAQRLGGASQDMPVPRWMAVMACSAAYVALGMCYGPSAEALQLMGLAFVLLVASLTDLAAWVIPRECIAGALLIRLIYLLFVWYQRGLGPSASLLAFSLAGSVALVVPLLLLVLALDRLLGTESMGGGDLKLFAVGGAFFGWMRGAYLVMVACVLGIAWYLLSPLCRRGASPSPRRSRHAFPFGPAISVAFVVTATIGGPTMQRLMGPW